MYLDCKCINCIINMREKKEPFNQGIIFDYLIFEKNLVIIGTIV